MRIRKFSFVGKTIKNVNIHNALKSSKQNKESKNKLKLKQNNFVEIRMKNKLNLKGVFAKKKVGIDFRRKMIDGVRY